MKYNPSVGEIIYNKGKGDDYEIIELLPDYKVKIKFLESENIKIVTSYRVYNKDLKDTIKRRKPPKEDKMAGYWDFINKTYDSWDESCGLDGAVKMPVFGISKQKGCIFDELRGSVIVDRWFYDKYKGIILVGSDTKYVSISPSKRNISKFFNVNPERRVKKGIPLHHFIRGHSNFKGFMIDHINNDPFDNRFCNLRTASHSQNSMNSLKSKSKKKSGHSKYKGVYFEKSKKSKTGKLIRCWRSTIISNGKQYYKWCYTEKEAALSYNELALQHFGEFASLNVVD